MIPVAIIGGGPAGATLAIALLQSGIESTIFEKNQQFIYKPGEGLSPLVRPLLSQLKILKALDLDKHVETVGHKSLWGNDDPQEFSFLYQPYGNGWHIDRMVFEKKLIDIACKRGAGWKPGHRLTSCRQDSDHWEIQFIKNGKKEIITSKFLVDATGRACIPSRMLGAKREGTDRLMGCSLVLPLRDFKIRKQYTLIETVEQGWWYAALLPNQKISLTFMTDADLIPFEASDVNAFFDLLKSTKMIVEYLGDVDFSEHPELIIKPAGTSKLNTCCGTNWLATGDAAMAFDPLSGYGLTAAMGGAYYAAQSITQHLKGSKTWENSYQKIMDETYQKSLPLFAEHYFREKRWDHLFWKRRHQF